MRSLVLVCAALLCAGCAADDLNGRTFQRPDVGDDASVTSPDAAAELDVPSTHEDDASNEADATHEDVGDNGLCRPNRDGVIERHEVSLQAGLSAKFRVATAAQWSTEPQDVDGEPTWDLSGEFATDVDTLIQLRSLAGTWFETKFPGADYYTPLSTSSDLLGVFDITDDAVLLLGVVSPEDGFLVTELTYNPPVPVLQFPLQAGDSWSVSSDITGWYEGTIIVGFYNETYVFEADDAGTLLTPYGTFPSIRVRSVLDRTVGFLTTVIRQFAFVTECFGTVATVTATDNEDGLEFSEVSELRRLAP